MIKSTNNSFSQIIDGCMHQQGYVDSYDEPAFTWVSFIFFVVVVRVILILYEFMLHLDFL